MKTLLIALTLITMPGCASLAYFAHEKVPCYTPRADVSPKADPNSDMAECTVLTHRPQAHEACMYLRGYEVGECYADTHAPVVKGATE